MTPQQFKAARTALGLTQVELAKALDMDVSPISRYECGVVDIPRTSEYAMEWLKINHLARATKTIGM